MKQAGYIPLLSKKKRNNVEDKVVEVVKNFSQLTIKRKNLLIDEKIELLLKHIEKHSRDISHTSGKRGNHPRIIRQQLQRSPWHTK